MPETKLVRIYVSDFDRLDIARKTMQAITREDMTIADAIRYLLGVFEAQQDAEYKRDKEDTACSD